MDGVDELGAARDSGERHAACDALGESDQVGDDALVIAGEPGAGTSEACLNLVGDEDDAVLLGPRDERREESFCGNDESALALNGLDEDGGRVGSTDLLLDHRDGALCGLLTGDLGAIDVEALAVRVGHRDAVDLGGERTEAALVRHGLRGQCHREVGAAVVRVVEDDDCVATGCVTGDLDGVLDGFCAGVEQHGTLLVVTGGELGEDARRPRRSPRTERP